MGRWAEQEPTIHDAAPISCSGKGQEVASWIHQGQHLVEAQTLNPANPLNKRFRQRLKVLPFSCGARSEPSPGRLSWMSFWYPWPPQPLHCPAVLKSDSPSSMICNGGGGGSTVPVMEKLKGASSRSLLPKESSPLALPVAVAVSWTINVVDSPGCRLV